MLGWVRQLFSTPQRDAAAASDEPGDLAELERQAEQQLSQGAHAEAAQSYRRILANDAESAQAHARLGTALKAMGNTEEAKPCAQRALALDPAHAEAHYLLAGIAAGSGDAATAHEHYRQAVDAAPGFEAAYLDWCRLLFQENRLDEATLLVERGLTHLPESVYLRLYLGNLRHTQGRFADAADEYQEAVRRLPENPSILANLGLAQMMAGRYDIGIATLQRALTLDPASVDANLSLGRAWLDLGKHDMARACFERALELDPAHVGARYNLGHLGLLLGDFEAGWSGFQVRDQQPGLMRNPVFAQPLFSLDADVAGKTVLLYSEQGYGDTLQFIRYAALIAQRGARVVAAVPPPLASLIARCPGVAAVTVPNALPEFDYHSPLLSLPQIFKTDLATIPHAIPYLNPAPERIAHWRTRLGPSNLPRVGLVWSGDPRKYQVLANHTDAMRSMPFSRMLPLLDVPGIEFHSLQLGADAVAQLAGHPQVIDHTGELFDFQETAALIGQLDLVISVDTSVVHLVGGLGKPVWMLNRFNTCWRWLLERSDSPWYPGMRIFRQHSFGDWQPVIADVEQALIEFAHQRHARQE